MKSILRRRKYSFEYYFFLKGIKKERVYEGTPFLFCFGSLFYHSKFASCESKICSLLVLMKDTSLLWWLPEYPIFFSHFRFLPTIYNCQCNILSLHHLFKLSLRNYCLFVFMVKSEIIVAHHYICHYKLVI